MAIGRSKKHTGGKSIELKDRVKKEVQKIVVDSMIKVTDDSMALKHIGTGFSFVFGTKDNKLINKYLDWFLSSGNPNRQCPVIL